MPGTERSRDALRSPPASRSSSTTTATSPALAQRISATCWRGSSFGARGCEAIHVAASSRSSPSYRVAQVRARHRTAAHPPVAPVGLDIRPRGFQAHSKHRERRNQNRIDSNLLGDQRPNSGPAPPDRHHPEPARRIHHAEPARVASAAIASSPAWIAPSATCSIIQPPLANRRRSTARARAAPTPACHPGVGPASAPPPKKHRSAPAPSIRCRNTLAGIGAGLARPTFSDPVLSSQMIRPPRPMLDTAAVGISTQGSPADLLLAAQHRRTGADHTDIGTGAASIQRHQVSVRCSSILRRVGRGGRRRDRTAAYHQAIAGCSRLLRPPVRPLRCAPAHRPRSASPSLSRPT